MKGDEARKLLGFPPNCRPSALQVKAAYKRKVWESHPDRFPVHEKSCAESKFKLISEAYRCLQSGPKEGSGPGPGPASGSSAVLVVGFFWGTSGRSESSIYRVWRIGHFCEETFPNRNNLAFQFDRKDSIIDGSGNPSVVPKSHEPQQETTPDSI